MGVTPNRGYPYPDLNSPTTVAADLEALAVAYDADLANIRDTLVQQRPMFRAVGGEQQVFGDGPTCTLSFGLLETNTGGALTGASTILPRTSFVPTIPGLWHFTATVSFPRWHTNVTWVKMRLFSSFEISGAITTEMPNVADGSRTLSVTGVQLMSGTGTGNPVSVVMDATNASQRRVLPFTSRSLTGVLISRT